MLHDLLILGGGPAGLSAALTAKARGLDTLLLTKAPEKSRLAKAPRIDNYPGFTGISGKGFLETVYAAAAEQGLVPLVGTVNGILPLGDRFTLSAGAEVYEARALILATGLPPQRLFDGEADWLGRGVSYCATCDGMLYRGRKVAVIGLADDAEKEAQFLRQIGCEAEYFDRRRASRFVIKGNDHVTALEADGISYPADAVFILRDAVKPDTLLPGLETDGAHICTDASMATNMAGVFAAGDCTGTPYQITRAVGQGTVAALSASEYLNERNTQ